MTRLGGRGVPLALAALAATLALAVAGCGSDDSSDTTELMPAPPVKEDVGEAVKRMKKVADTGDCDKINELNPLGRPAAATKTRCLALQRVLPLKVTGAEQYGKLGAVVSFQRGLATLNAVLLRDADGLLHVSSIEGLSGEDATKGKLAKQFKEVADKGTQALADRNCDAFLPYAFRRFGIGAGTDDEVCTRVQNNIVAAELEAGGSADPGQPGRRLDLRLLRRRHTGLVHHLGRGAREREGPAQGTSPSPSARLPKGAPEYGIADAVRTNTDEPIEAAPGRRIDVDFVRLAGASYSPPPPRARRPPRPRPRAPAARAACSARVGPVTVRGSPLALPPGHAGSPRRPRGRVASGSVSVLGAVGILGVRLAEQRPV